MKKKKQQKASPIGEAEKEQVRARRAVGHDFAIRRDEHGRERLAAGTAEAGRRYELASGGKVVRVRTVDPLAGISSLTALQRQAGTQYRDAFEGSQVSGVRGVLLQERVDVGSGAEYFPAALIDRGRAFQAATRAVGHNDIVAVVQGVCSAGHSVSALAGILSEPRDVVVKLLKIGLDNLAVHYGLMLPKRRVG